LLSVPFFLEIVGHGAGERLRLGGAEARDAAVLNPILDQWAAAIGEPVPYLRVVDGRLDNARRVTLVDFRQAGFDAQVASGFYDWEQGYRWLGSEGVLRLTLEPYRLHLLLAAPISALHARGLAAGGIGVAVSATDLVTGMRMPLGECRVARDGLEHCSLDLTPFLARVGNGRAANVTLTADTTWRPVDVLPGNADQRQLSVQVVAVSGGKPPP
jgi:hypothetical protein